MPRAGFFVRASETWGAHTGLLGSDVTESSELELDHGPFVKPIRWRQGNQYTERTNAGSAIRGKWQQ
jgi:hypothetical protein